MPLVKDAAVIDDPWTVVEDDAPLPDGPAIVSLERLRAEAESLAARNAPVGVRLDNTVEVDEIKDLLGRVSLIALHFPKFGDGRAYSQARLLRERLRFDGEVRATGDVLEDQLFFMRRCGFDAFLLPEDRDPATALRLLDGFSAVYQTAADGRTRAADLRRKRRDAAA